MRTAIYIYTSIKFWSDGSKIFISQWCRAGREIFEVNTLGLDGVE